MSETCQIDNHDYQYSDSLNGRCRVCDRPQGNSIHRTTFTWWEVKELRAQIATLTQQKEQAEREYDVLGHQHFELRRKLTAAEAEVKRLREGIAEIVYAYSDYRAVLEQPHKLIADLKALLAQPSDGKETTDAQ